VYILTIRLWLDRLTCKAADLTTWWRCRRRRCNASRLRAGGTCLEQRRPERAKRLWRWRWRSCCDCHECRNSHLGSRWWPRSRGSGTRSFVHCRAL